MAACAPEEQAVGKDVTIQCTTLDAEEITGCSASLKGTVLISDASSEQAEVWFMIGMDASSVSSNGVKVSAGTVPAEGGAVSAVSTDLEPETTYYFVVCASIDEKQARGEVKSFKTNGSGASVSTVAATDVGLVTATLSGKLSADDTEVGFVYGYEETTLEELKTSGTVVSATLSGDSFSVTLNNLRLDKTYHYAAMAIVHDDVIFGSVKTFTTKARSGDIPSGAVELELSVMWATCNIGADVAEDYGDYYSWGETETKTNYDASTYKWFNGSSTSIIKYNTSSEYGSVDNKTVLEPEDDVAHVKLGGSWRMPTIAEWKELRENCLMSWTTQNGVRGRLVTSSKNGNSIFLPAAGQRHHDTGSSTGDGGYWSSSLRTDSPQTAWCLVFTSTNVGMGSWSRCYAQSVRAVTE